MAVAADIDEAIFYSLTHVSRIANNATESLRAHLVLWMNTFSQFDDQSDNERTVRNWKVPTNFYLQRLPVGVGATQAFTQMEFSSSVSELVWQAVCAAKYAQIDGRITAAQVTQMVADWNTAWGYV